MVIFSGIFIENERNMNGIWEKWGPKWAVYFIRNGKIIELKEAGHRFSGDRTVVT
jgi:hypothetical protein